MRSLRSRSVLSRSEESWSLVALPRLIGRHNRSRQHTLTYSATFKYHLAHPRNVGELSEANAVAEETNPICGDRMRLALVVRDTRIEKVKFLAYGCPPTLVTGSVLTELITGKTINQARALTSEELIDSVGGLPNRKHHAAALAIEALASALKNFGVR